METRKVPWTSEEAGRDAGFRIDLSPATENKEIINRCISDFQKYEGKVIILGRILGAPPKARTFLIFQITSVYDAPMIVYAVEKGKIKFKFPCACGVDA